MRSAAVADWRSRIPFEQPVALDTVVPGDDARCAGCTTDAPTRPRSELWAYKHRHPRHHDGYVRLYCAEHVPLRTVAAPPEAARPAARRGGVDRQPRTPRRPAAPERVAAVCPDCFVEVPASGICGVCGTAVSAG